MDMPTLYHNPRCSKSRQALALLGDAGITPQVVLYLETPPTVAALQTLVEKLGLTRAHDLLRTKEAEYQQAGLTPDASNQEVLEAIHQFPKLLERPILVVGQRAVIGRPPENVLELIK